MAQSSLYSKGFKPEGPERVSLGFTVGATSKRFLGVFNASCSMAEDELLLLFADVRRDGGYSWSRVVADVS